MGIHTIKLPDVGEGIAEAELTEWAVAIGDVVREDDILAVVMTDKAAVEVPSSVEGKVVWLGGEVGEILAIGSDLIRIEVLGEGNTSQTSPSLEPTKKAAPEPVLEPKVQEKVVRDAAPNVVVPSVVAAKPTPRRAEGEKPLASPSVRQRARDEGVDLRQVTGSGPAGRITHDDLDVFFQNGAAPVSSGGRAKNTSVTVVGMRRKIAEKMALSKARIPHITIVEEVDVTNLEELRTDLNKTYDGKRPKLTVLPFMMRAVVEAVREQPELNAHFDDDAGVVHQYGGVHIGMAAQTPSGLVVPVIKHAEARSLWDSAGEIMRLAEVARDGKASREELSGSTITITSLGPLGAIATTPIINHPEVAIIGVNKMSIRPWWDGQQFVPRKMMNISCAFDHRVIDGYVAAVFVQKLKTLLEKPAMLFLEP
jgi:2-oxoisovalerate dehydrogenase E2 component (dihydrolipoyl transacylase)